MDLAEIVQLLGDNAPLPPRTAMIQLSGGFRSGRR
jgi:hypothetical protein